MFQIEAAGLVIRIENRYEDVQNLCRDYITGDERKADLRIAVSEEELRAEMAKKPELFFGDGYGEEVVVYEKISNALPAFDAFVMHSSVVAVEGKAYAFAAESGTGKTTHTRYWKEVLGERLTVINGDKPIYRFNSQFTIHHSELKQHRSEKGEIKHKKNVLLAYGTPWCGKEGWQTKTSAPLTALCLLERSEENEIFPVNPMEHLGELMKHFHLPGNGMVDMPKMIQMIDRMVATVPVYRLRCRNAVSAAETAIRHFGL